MKLITETDIIYKGKGIAKGTILTVGAQLEVGDLVAIKHMGKEVRELEDGSAGVVEEIHPGEIVWKVPATIDELHDLYPELCEEIARQAKDPVPTTIDELTDAYPHLTREMYQNGYEDGYAAGKTPVEVFPPDAGSPAIPTSESVAQGDPAAGKTGDPAPEAQSDPGAAQSGSGRTTRKGR